MSQLPLRTIKSWRTQSGR